MKKLLPALCFALLISLYGCHSGNADKEAAVRSKAVSFIEGVIVTPTVLNQTLTVSGTLKAFEETVLMPEVSGRIVQLNMPEGKAVKQGTLLAKLFDGDWQAQLSKAQAQFQLAELTEKRQNELLKLNGISQSDYDQTLLQVNSIKADIEVLKAQIRKTEILAPFDGTVGLRNVSMGAEVTSSTALTTLRAVDRLKLDFYVPEKYSGQIKSGMPLTFTAEGNDRPFSATVLATEEGIEASSRTLKVRAVVKAGTSSLVPGAFVTVTLQLGENKNALMIPTQAIIPKERDKKVIVARQGKAVFVTVKTGVRQALAVEVLSGLSPGDTVVTTGLLFLKPGMDLSFAKVTK